MRVLLDAAVVDRWHVVVDDMQDILHVNATGSHSGSNENRGISRSESPHSRLSLLLGTLTVHGGDWQMHVEKEIIQVVSSLTTVDEDDRANAMHLLEQLDQQFFLLMGFSLKNNLLDVGCSASGTANAESNVRSGEIVLGKVTGGLGERGREKAELDVALILFC
jgi:hypothetical protein